MLIGLNKIPQNSHAHCVCVPWASVNTCSPSHAGGCPPPPAPPSHAHISPRNTTGGGEGWRISGGFKCGAADRQTSQTQSTSSCHSSARTLGFGNAVVVSKVKHHQRDAHLFRKRMREGDTVPAQQILELGLRRPYRALCRSFAVPCETSQSRKQYNHFDRQGSRHLLRSVHAI